MANVSKGTVNATPAETAQAAALERHQKQQDEEAKAAKKPAPTKHVETENEAGTVKVEKDVADTRTQGKQDVAQDITTNAEGARQDDADVSVGGEMFAALLADVLADDVYQRASARANLHLMMRKHKIKPLALHLPVVDDYVVPTQNADITDSGITEDDDLYTVEGSRH
jgi:hypothetical protein